jgi:hypothetical protein
VARIVANSAAADRIDAAIQKWQQGDVALDERWVFHVADPRAALTDEAAESEEEGLLAVPSSVEGLVVVSQTCDVVRKCVDRPFVEVSPLRRAPAGMLNEIGRGQSNRFARLPGLPDQAMAVDLERTMTVEKAILATWKRTRGCLTDPDSRAFARALARKRARFAFPDGFVEMVKPMQVRLASKHAKRSPEGHALQALREIRVQASPAWSAGASIFFWFIRNDEQVEFEGKGWDHWLVLWLNLVVSSSQYGQPEGLVTTLQEMTAADYVASDPLDLDYLST